MAKTIIFFYPRYLLNDVYLHSVFRINLIYGMYIVI